MGSYGSYISDQYEKLNYAYNRVLEERDTLMEELAVEKRKNAKLRKALKELLSCPYTLDTASVPALGVDAAPPGQVVGVLSVAWTRMQKTQALLKPQRKEKKRA